MRRVVAYIDGFNLYKGLTDHRRRHPGALDHSKVDLWRLIEHLLHEGEELAGVRWYTSIPPVNWRDPEQAAQVQRHKIYRARLETTGVLTRVSDFRKSIRVCKHCGKRTKEPQEKESDERCVLEILEDAVYDRADRALIVSSDSDLVPALYALKRYAERCSVDAVVAPPIERVPTAKELTRICGQLFGTATRYMRVSHVRASLFDGVDESSASTADDEPDRS